MIEHEHEHAYYRAALATLKYLDDRGARRLFGPDADARWSMFTTEPAVLIEQDRIDLVLRDADVQWPSAFAARVVFDLEAVAQDDAFGSAWCGQAPTGLWSMMSSCTFELHEIVNYILAVWRQPAVMPTSRSVSFVLRTPSEVALALLDFAQRGDPFWSRDVRVVADVDTDEALCTRQLGALAGAILRQPTKIERP